MVTYSTFDSEYSKVYSKTYLKMSEGPYLKLWKLDLFGYQFLMVCMYIKGIFASIYMSG